MYLIYFALLLVNLYSYVIYIYNLEICFAHIFLLGLSEDDTQTYQNITNGHCFATVNSQNHELISNAGQSKKEYIKILILSMEPNFSKLGTKPKFQFYYSNKKCTKY